MADYWVQVVERDGTPVDAVPSAQIERLSWELNAAGDMHFSVPQSEARLTAVKVLTREVQVWKDGTCIWWGVPLSDRFSGDRYEVRCEGVMWHLAGRHVGPAGRTNLLINGSFDTGDFTGWNTTGVVATVVNGWGMRAGAHQANLWNNDPGGSGDLHIHQNHTVTGQAYYILSAWFHIRTDMTWIGPALENRGLFVERRRVSDNAVLQVQFIPIDDNTERGVYHREQLGIHASPGEFLNVRLYTPRQSSGGGTVNPPGSIIWDDVALNVMESLYFHQATLHEVVAGLVSHAQNTALGKSNVNIGTAGVDVSGAAPRTTRAYQYADHANILEALEEFPQMGMLDFAVVLNPTGTTKTLTSYYPRKGSVRNDLALEWGRNIVDYAYERDGSNTRSSVIVLGEGEGASRDEAGAIDTSQVGGLTIEDVFAAPGETFHDVLPAIAAQRLAARRSIPVVPVVTVNESATPLIGVLDLGDSVPVRIEDGALVVDETRRVVKLELHPETELLDVTVN